MKPGPCHASARLSAAGLVMLVAMQLVACGEGPPLVAELAGRTMGTSYSIKLSPAPDATLGASLQRQVERRLDEINAQMSTYRPDSDLSRFNQTLHTDWQPQPEPVVALVEQAAKISQLSGGGYDVTVGPLVNLWGFGTSGNRETAPTQEEINGVLKRVGFRQLHTRKNPPALRKDVAALEVDLSSIAKGWAVDQLAELVQTQGFDNYLVEIGGEVRAQGEKSPGKPWRIAIEQPSFDARSVQRVVTLRDTAMATSGDYRNFFVDGDQLYSHTIDPQTGQTVRHRLASVTVLAEDCAMADAWATALLALGEQRAARLADSIGLKALFIVRSADGLEEKHSRALANSDLLDE